MNLDSETLEILMGKRLDGEISSAEARLLQTHLDQDADAGQLLDQLQDLHRSSQEAVTEAVLGPGRSAQDIIDAAMQQSRGNSPLRLLKRVVFSQFAAGLAAGLLIAAAGLLAFSKPLGQQQPTGVGPQEAGTGLVRDAGMAPRFAGWPQPGNRTQRNVDWIVFTDKQGEHYLLEGLREDKRIRPAVYQGDF
jgi:hypothetical protein